MTPPLDLCWNANILNLSALRLQNEKELMEMESREGTIWGIAGWMEPKCITSYTEGRTFNGYLDDPGG